VELAPRQIWPSNLGTLGIPLSGKIGVDQVAGPGRAVGRLTDVGWGNRLRELFASTADEPVPDDLFDACVAVLAAWKWERRPVGVVVLGSSRRSQLVTSLGERIAAIGRLRFLGQVDSHPTEERRLNSAQRVAQLWASLHLAPDLANQLSTVDGPVLLVDDQVETGWTMALSAKLLRDAGAPEVLPLALATTT
jgi:ATP-dependent DNA helicase RecQ